MTGMTMINDAALETIVGYVRVQPGLKSRILGKISNGRKVNTTGKRVYKDGYTWYEIAIKARAGSQVVCLVFNQPE